jgi:magnesium transporter
MQVLDTLDVATIRALHEREEFFWLDLVSPTDEELDALGDLLDIPRLALEDTKEFGERPKIDDYGPRVLIVFYGAHDDALVEVHVHVSGNEVVTVRRGECANLWETHRQTVKATTGTEQHVVYKVLDALAESLRALVNRYAEEVQQLEDAAFDRPTSAHRRRMSELRAKLYRLQQIVVPQRDMLASGGDLIESLPGLERDAARHPFRDVHDDLVLTSNQIDYLRELLAEAVNVLLNQMAGRLTVVATVFLPLTFATGFFGMNFGWMVSHVDSAAAFFLLGVGSMLVTIGIAAVLLVRAGYLGRRPR